MGLRSDAEGKACALLGLAVQTMDGEPEPLDQIQQSRSEDIVGRYESWAGRWLLVAGTRVHVDASALLGVFYGRDDRGRVWASSSPALIAAQLDLRDADEFRGDALRHESGISWCPPPATPSPRVSRLLPSQVLDMGSGVVEARRLLPPVHAQQGRDDTIGQIQRALIQSCRGLPQQSRRIWMSLSAGSDSRVVFAAAQAAGVPMTAFTRISSRMSVADYLLPPQMAERLGYGHRYIAPKRRDPGRMKLVEAHAASFVSKGDALPLIEGHRDGLDGILLGGQCFGVGKVLGRSGTRGAWRRPKDLSAMVARMQGEPLNSSRLEAIERWAHWAAETPVEGLDWRDRYYLEQRLAGWQSSKEQVYDMQPHERFVPINCARTYSLLLSLPEAQRATLDHHRLLIRAMSPALADFPVNPPDAYFGIPQALRLRVFKIQSWRQPRWWLRQGLKALGKKVRNHGRR